MAIEEAFHGTHLHQGSHLILNLCCVNAKLVEMTIPQKISALQFQNQVGRDPEQDSVHGMDCSSVSL